MMRSFTVPLTILFSFHAFFVSAFPSSIVTVIVSPTPTPSPSPTTPSPTTPTISSETPALTPIIFKDGTSINVTAYDPNLPDPNYHTPYPGPIRRLELNYYLLQYDPHWWRLNLDILTQTACLCSNASAASTPAHVASYVQFEYYNHFHGHAYALSHTCGPEPAQEKYNVCWSTATGSRYHGRAPPKEYTECWFDDEDGQRLCVNWMWKGHRWMSFHGHRREFDRGETHVWDERAEHVRESCGGWCREKFGMEMDVDGDHEESFIRSWFPPKPIPWHE